MRPDVGVWNLLFACVQLRIGLGMLFRRTVKPAIVAMAIWAFGVWWFGEGFGGLLNDTASPLMGAPGAVVLYPLIGMLVWPREAGAEAPESGIASSAAAAGPLGPSAPLFVWSGFWVLSGALWLFPANRSGGAVRSMVSSMADGKPSWYSHSLRSVANAVAHSGSGLAWTLAAISLVIGVGPLLSRRPGPFLVAGSALQVVFWVTGMAAGGGPLTMDPTDQQVVEAAIMAQQDGQAPVTPGAQVPTITGSCGTSRAGRRARAGRAPAVWLSYRTFVPGGATARPAHWSSRDAHR